MLYKKWFVYYDTCKKDINTGCEQIAGPLNVEACDAYGYHHEPKKMCPTFFLFTMKLHLNKSSNREKLLHDEQRSW
jgi:hypothetical protein